MCVLASSFLTSKRSPLCLNIAQFWGTGSYFFPSNKRCSALSLSHKFIFRLIFIWTSACRTNILKVLSKRSSGYILTQNCVPPTAVGFLYVFMYMCCLYIYVCIHIDMLMIAYAYIFEDLRFIYLYLHLHLYLYIISPFLHLSFIGSLTESRNE